jgi:alkylhydroperoxidase family enzyme
MRVDLPRLAPLTDTQMSEDALAVMAPIIARGTDLNILRTMAHRPAALAKFLEWANYILSKANSLPARTREIAILRTGFNCGSGYEWAQHVLIGKRCGLTDAEVTRIKLGANAPGWDIADAALLVACDDLCRDHFITDRSWAALSTHFSQDQCMDLVLTVGQYTQVSMLLNSFGVQLDAGLTLDPDLDHRV